MASSLASTSPATSVADVLQSAPFKAWKRRLNAIAKREHMVPAAVTFPGEMSVWAEHFQAGKTPRQAWDAVPYARRG